MTVPHAAEVKVFSANALRAVLSELVAAFERGSGHHVSINWSTTAQTLSRIRDGETADMVIATGPGIDKLTKQGKIAPDSRTELGSSLIGIGVRAGSLKPDIVSVEAFRRTLLEAKTIAYSTLGQSGMHFEQVIARLGISSELKPKLKAISGGLVGELVVRAEAELGVQMIGEILAVEGFELVAPFPPELQQINTFAAAIFADAPHADTARLFIDFLATPAAARSMQAKGLEMPSH